MKFSMLAIMRRVGQRTRAGMFVTKQAVKVIDRLHEVCYIQHMRKSITETTLTAPSYEGQQCALRHVNLRLQYENTVTSFSTRILVARSY